MALEADSPRARRLPLDERRDQLIELGIRIFSEHPYDTVSTGQIAEAAGISKGLLYHYFPSKRDFYVATVRTVAQRLRQATTPDPEREFLDAVRDTLARFVDFVESNAAIYRVLVRSGVGADAEVEAILEERREVACRRVVSGLAIREPTPLLRSALRGWVGFVDAATFEWLERRDYSKETLLRLLVASLQAMLDTVEQAEAASAPTASARR